MPKNGATEREGKRKLNQEGKKGGQANLKGKQTQENKETQPKQKHDGTKGK